MDIVDVTKFHLAVCVKLFLLNSTALESVGLSSRPRASIINPESVSRKVHIASGNLCKHPLIINISIRHETLAGLTRAPNRATCILVEVGQGWEALLGAKFGATDQGLVRNALGYHA
jgi:hypothetical protein